MFLTGKCMYGREITSVTDKVITQRKLESTSVVMGTVVVDTLDNPVALTREEIITKFNLSEDNPIPLIKKSRKKTEEPVA